MDFFQVLLGARPPPAGREGLGLSGQPARSGASTAASAMGLRGRGRGWDRGGRKREGRARRWVRVGAGWGCTSAAPARPFMAQNGAQDGHSPTAGADCRVRADARARSGWSAWSERPRMHACAAARITRSVPAHDPHSIGPLQHHAHWPRPVETRAPRTRERTSHGPRTAAMARTRVCGLRRGRRRQPRSPARRRSPTLPLPPRRL